MPARAPSMTWAMAVSPKPRPPLSEPSQASEPQQASELDSADGDRAFRTLSGEAVRELYTAEDLPEGVGGPDDPIGRPGSYPFTRGIHETMYRGRLWTMPQFAGFGTSEEANERFRYLTHHGPTGPSPRRSGASRSTRRCACAAT